MAKHYSLTITHTSRQTDHIFCLDDLEKNHEGITKALPPEKTAKLARRKGTWGGGDVGCDSLCQGKKKKKKKESLFANLQIYFGILSRKIWKLMIVSSRSLDNLPLQ